MDEERARAKNPTDLPLTLEVVRLIAAANEESVRRQHEYIGTEHLVLALTHGSDSPAPLRDLAIEPDRVHTLIDTTIQGLTEDRAFEFARDAGAAR